MSSYRFKDKNDKGLNRKVEQFIKDAFTRGAKDKHILHNKASVDKFTTDLDSKMEESTSLNEESNSRNDKGEVSEILLIC